MADEGFYKILSCPCCGYTPQPTEIHADEEHCGELQECPECIQASIEVEWDDGRGEEEEY